MPRRAGKYALERGCVKGAGVVVVGATEAGGQRRACMVKFLTSRLEFERELRLRQLLLDSSPLPGAPLPCPACSPACRSCRAASAAESLPACSPQRSPSPQAPAP